MDKLIISEISPLETQPSARNTNQLDLLTGDEALNLIDDFSFRESWRNLYNSCPWSTVFQSWEFAASWYHVFRGEYLPVIVKSESEGRLNGLLTMAIPTSDLTDTASKFGSVRIIGAGEYEAEYHCWLAETANGESFITSALSMLLDHYPKSKINFRYIPPAAPLAWLNSPKWKTISIQQTFKRPLLEMSSPLAEKAFRINNQYKTKLNRLKRLGNVSFERVTDDQVFESILPELTLQFDFRQGGLFNKNQFRDKPLKGEFMKELFRNGILHVTTLKLDDEIIGSLVGVAGKGWVHLQGINTHSPFYAKHSPGMLHFLSLGQLLAKEGVTVFDLTPGGDSYKERMATSHDQVCGLVISNNTAFRLKRLLKKQLYSYWVKKGMRPMSVELSMKRKKYFLKHKLKKAKQEGYVKATLRWLKNKKQSANEQVFVKDLKSEARHISLNIRKNSLSDLLDFDHKDISITRWEFMENAMQLYESGNQSYTWATDGRLLACVWLGQIELEPQEQSQTSHSTVPTLMHLYCHPNAEEKLTDFLDNVSEIVVQDLNTHSLYAIIDPVDALYKHSLLKAGFNESKHNRVS